MTYFGDGTLIVRALSLWQAIKYLMACFMYICHIGWCTVVAVEGDEMNYFDRYMLINIQILLISSILFSFIAFHDA